MTSPNRQTFTFATDDQLTPTLGRQSSAAGATTQKLNKLGDEARKVAGKMTLAEKATAKVTRELDQQKRKVQELTAAYHLLDPGQQMGRVKELELARGKQSELEKALKVLKPSGPGGRSGGLMGGLFSRAVGSPLLAAGIGAGVAGSPVIAAAVNAAVLGALGSAAVGLGIASAIRQDQNVRQSFADLGREFVSVFDEMGKPFVEPLRGAAAFFRQELFQVSGEWVRAVGGLSGVVQPLAKGIAGLFRQATPGFVKALEASRPVLEKLAATLPGLGEDISTMLESFAQAGPAATQAMGDLVEGLGDLLVVAGEGVEALSKVYYWGTQLGALNYARDPQIKMIKGVSSAWTDTARATELATKRLQDWNAAMDTAFGKAMSLDEANDAFKTGLLELKAAVQENGTSLSDATLKGLANRDMLRDLVQRANDARDAQIEMGDGTKAAIEKANAAYLTHLQQIRANMVARGFEAGAIDALIAKYVALTKLPNITKTVTVRQVSSSIQGGSPRGTVGFFAEGGPVQRGVPVVVGERRAEVFVPESDGYIHPDARKFGGGGPVEVHVVLEHRWPDGKVQVEKFQQHAKQSGKKTVSQVYGMPA